MKTIKFITALIFQVTGGIYIVNLMFLSAVIKSAISRYPDAPKVEVIVKYEEKEVKVE